ncbi:DNA (cytosine-5-)-methyltransferase [Bradyrhizobium sp. AUGA SZCCT0177]|uniref:DNA cytosine methyltransferase n=1 Tax=Bradyrhizobium sp. AUGA SZCCT0177 TaxID=2807665 RepID=UPI001BAA91B7|nr:DNA (cytosine-5-)-methyltransferase [Bradyrhizobium sp. AUGA SZCCT0177]MBR1284056.1 DNA (cytosine-5-)-methyltransferase [Bradyrhizobium sp. AUGA SZCCT0177]
MRVASLFSGIGGFELGLSRAGFETVMMCENDPLARSVLLRRFPRIPIRGDVTKIRRLPKCDILTAGWPCQDLSQAGRTAGIEGHRSGLISEVFRILEAASEKPEFVLLENVAFALHLQGGAALKFVTSNLERLGYKWAYRILDSRQFGVPQRRRRVFILGSRNLSPQSILFRGSDNTSSEDTSSPVSFGFYWTEGNTGLGWSPEAVPPLKGGSALSIPSPPAIWKKETRAFITPGISDAERMQGFPANWTAVGPLKKERKRNRWKLIGNAVSVPVVEWIGRCLIEQATVDVKAKPIRQIPKMPTAAFGEQGSEPSFFSFNSEGPDAPTVGSLKDFKLSDASELSLRAAAGFLSRIEKSSLKTHPRFIPDLRDFVS